MAHYNSGPITLFAIREDRGRAKSNRSRSFSRSAAEVVQHGRDVAISVWATCLVAEEAARKLEEKHLSRSSTALDQTNDTGTLEFSRSAEVVHD
jgi:hypothetical protein